VGTETREAIPPIIGHILKEGHHFSLFQAVRLLEHCYPKAPGIGATGPAGEEVVRIRSDTILSKPRTLVKDVERTGERRYRITQNLMGLYGARTPLPTIYSLEIARRDPEGDPVRDFLDLFNHRLLSLRYRAWARSRPEVLYRREGEDDPIAHMILCVLGIPADLASKLPNPMRRGLARYAALFSKRVRTAAGLEVMLSDHLEGAPVRVQPYALRYVRIPERQRCSLGRSSCRLGDDFVLGASVADRAGKFRLRIGPLDYSDFLDLAPGGSRRQVAGTLVHTYLMDNLEHDVELGIPADEKPPLRLGDVEAGARLGVDTWFCTAKQADSWERFQGFDERVTASRKESQS
jgi:type VI secretion system protein ImpH